MVRIKRRTQLLTRYPELYRHTYWAGNSYDPDYEYELNKERTLCANRDFVAERYKLQTFLDKDKTNRRYKKQFEVFREINERMWEIRDHIEYYKTRGGNIACIFSNYDSVREDHEACVLIGYTKIEPVYEFNANTYIKIISPTTRETIV